MVRGGGGGRSGEEGGRPSGTFGSSVAMRLGLLSETSQSLSFLSVEPVTSSPGAPGLKDIVQVGLSWAWRV